MYNIENLKNYFFKDMQHIHIFAFTIDFYSQDRQVVHSLLGLIVYNYGYVVFGCDMTPKDVKFLYLTFLVTPPRNMKSLNIYIYI